MAAIIQIGHGRSLPITNIDKNEQTYLGIKSFDVDTKLKIMSGQCFCVQHNKAYLGCRNDCLPMFLRLKIVAVSVKKFNVIFKSLYCIHVEDGSWPNGHILLSV